MTESKLQEGDVRLDLTFNPLLLQAPQVQACGVHVLHLLEIYYDFMTEMKDKRR